PARYPWKLSARHAHRARPARDPAQTSPGHRSRTLTGVSDTSTMARTPPRQTGGGLRTAIGPRQFGGATNPPHACVPTPEHRGAVLNVLKPLRHNHAMVIDFPDLDGRYHVTMIVKIDLA